MQLYVLDRSKNTLESTSSFYNEKHTKTLGAGGSTFEFTVDKTDVAAQYLSTGNYIVFLDDRGRPWSFSIINYDENQLTKTVYCEDAGMELINKAVDVWTNMGNHSFEYYFNIITENTPWKIGINQISGLSRTLEYTGRDTGLGRLLSVLTAFDNAECKFNVKIKQNRPVEFTVDIYKQIGTVQDDMQITYNNELNDIKKSESRAAFVTALSGVGGVIEQDTSDTTVVTEAEQQHVDFADIEYDDGDFVSPKGSKWLYAKTANHKFNPNAENSYIEDYNDYDTQSSQELFNRTLTKLKTYSEPQYTYDADVKVIDPNLDIGDTVTIIDHEYNPALYLSARVATLVKCYSDPTQNTVTFTNYQILSDDTDNKLKAMQNIINSMPSSASIQAITSNLKLINQTIEDLNSSVKSTNAKNTNWYGPDEPENANDGDTWFEDAGDGKTVIKQFVDGGWQVIIDTHLADDIDKQIDSAKVNIDTVTKTANDAVAQAQQLAGQFADQVQAVTQLSKATDEAKAQAVNAISQVTEVRTQAASANASALKAQLSADDAMHNANVAIDNFNNLEIGGTNLLRDTAFTKNDGTDWDKVVTLTDGFMDHSGVVIDATKLTSGYVDGASQTIYSENASRVQLGEWYTLSFYAKGKGQLTTYEYPTIVDSTAGNYRDGVFVTDVPTDGNHWWDLTDEWKRHSITFKTKLDAVKGIVLFRATAGNLAYVCMPKLERGNTVSDYSQAPDDVQVQIDNINGELSQKVSQTAVDTLTGRVTTNETLAKQNKDTISTLAKQADVDTLTGTVRTAETNITQNARAIELKADQSYVDGISVGGRNYLLGSKSDKPRSFGAQGITLSFENYDDSTKMIHLVSTGSSNSAGFYISDASLSEKFENGDMWAFSADMMGTGMLRIMWRESSLNNANQDLSLTNKWVRYSNTGILQDSAKGAWCIYFNSTDAPVDAYIKLIKIEKANKPTDWSPAPEDNDSKITNLSASLKTQADQISLMASKNDLDTAINGMATQNYVASQLKVTSDSINQSVSSVKKELENISVGGTNLVAQSKSRPGYVNGADGTVSPAQSFRKETISEYISVTPGETYSLQLWGTTPASNYYWWGIGEYKSDKSFYVRVGGNGITQTNDTSDYFTGSLTIPADVYFVRVSYRAYDDYKVKFEKGNTPTDWSPAPEDTDAQINTLSTNIQEQADQITLMASKNDLDTATSGMATQNYVSSQIKVSADAINQTVSLVKTSMDNLSVGGTNLIVHAGEYVNQWLGTDGLKASGSPANTMKDYIAVTPGEILTFHQEYHDEHDHCFRWNWYTSDKQYIARTAMPGKVKFTWTVPANAYYLWVSYSNIGNVKLERGTIATDWSPAPEDQASSVEFSTLKQTVDGLSATVSNAASVSQLNQASDKLTAIIKGTGAPNLVPEEGWTKTGTGATFVRAGHPYYTGTHVLYELLNSTTKEVFAHSPYFKIKPNTTYTFSAQAFADDTVSSVDMYLLQRVSGSTKEFDEGGPHLIRNFKASPLASEYVTYTFTTGDFTEACIRIDNNASSKAPKNSALFFAEVQLEEGSTATAYRIADNQYASQLTSLTQTLNGLQTTVSNAATKTQVTQLSDSLSTEIKSVQQTANTNTTSITSVKQTLSGVQTTVANAATKSQVTQLSNQLTSVIGSIDSENMILDGDFTHSTVGQQPIGLHNALSADLTSIVANPVPDSALVPQNKNVLRISSDPSLNVDLLSPSNFNVTPGDQYYFEFLSRWNSPDQKGTIQLGLAIYNAAGKVIEWGSGASNANPAVWTKNSGTLTIPAGGVSAKIWLSWQNSAGSGQVMVTNLVAHKNYTTQSQITQLQDSINLRVTKDDVTTQIDVTAKGILLDGANTYITGKTHIDNSIITSAMIKDASISTAKIADVAITDAKIANINGSKIAANSITTDKLSVNFFQALSDDLNSIEIDGDNIEFYLGGDKSKSSLKLSNTGIGFGDIVNGNTTVATMGGGPWSSALGSYNGLNVGVMDGAEYVSLSKMSGSSLATKMVWSSVNQDSVSVRLGFNYYDYVTYNHPLIIRDKIYNEWGDANFHLINYNKAGLGIINDAGAGICLGNNGHLYILNKNKFVDSVDALNITGV